MNIDQLTEQFKTMEELKIFCQSQFKQILQLSKKIKELEDKNNDLVQKSKENKTLSLVNVDNTLPTNLGLKDDAEVIAQIQIKMLKEQAFGRELTLEETKKLEIFNKILKQPVEKDKPIKVDAKVLKEEDLLKVISEEKSVGTK